MRLRALMPVIGFASGAASLFGGSSQAAESKNPTSESRARATFAGGCFWSMEGPFDAVPGVESTTVGYAGGSTAHPTYEQVASGATQHAEVVQVVFDPRQVAYAQLLRVFWTNVDPLDPGGQFCDRGRHYRTAIFYETDAQRQAAEASKQAIEESGRFPWPIATQIEPLEAFYPAEAEHQDFYLTNLRRYWSYRKGCGRDERLKLLWGEEPK